MFKNSSTPLGSGNQPRTTRQNPEQIEKQKIKIEKQKIKVVIQNPLQKITGDMYILPNTRFQEQINRMRGDLVKCLIPMTDVTIEELGQKPITTSFILVDISHAYWIYPVNFSKEKIIY